MEQRPITPNLWGPHGWKFMHYISLGYPINPTSEDKINYKNFYYSLQDILPCDKCAINYQKNIYSLYKKSSIVCLPSYREGTPRSLLEAAAIGRPIVTTDTVGCREVVDDGFNGFLCKVRDALDLEKKMEKIIKISPEKRQVMGVHGRKKIEKKFDELIVIERYKEVIEKIVSKT